MIMTHSEVSDAKDTIQAYIDEPTNNIPEDVREALKNLIDYTGSAADEIASAEKSQEEAEADLDGFEMGARSRDKAMSHLETRYPRLFSGDLSKLDWSERRDLFDAISAIDLTHLHSTDSERTLARIDGKRSKRFPNSAPFNQRKRSERRN